MPTPGSRVRRVAGAIDPALGVLAFIGFISQVGIAVMLPLLPLYATELGATPFVLGLLTSSFAVTNAIGQLGTGFAVERWGSRRFITGGLGLYAAMNALIATAVSAPWLLAWRSLAGFGGGAMLVAERIYLAEVAQPSRRAFANGVISAAQSAGSVAGPAVGGLAATFAGLRAPFLLVALTSAIALVGTFFLPRPAAPPVAGSAPPTDDQRTDGEPIPYGPLGALLVANLALMASYGAFITTYAPFATTGLGWSTLDIGIAFSFLGGGSILLGPAMAHVADRFSRRAVAVVAPVPIAAFALGMVAALPQPVILALAFLAGGGLTAFNAAWYALLTDLAGERRRGRIFGVMSAISNGGIVVGALLSAELWTRTDVVAGLLVAVASLGIAALAMLTFRPRALPLAA